MRKTITYSSFVIASGLIIAAFITATNYVQLSIATLLYPIMVFFAFKIFKGKTNLAPAEVPIKKPEVYIPEEAKTKGEDISIADVDKRTFLKLIGAAGLTFFLSSILSRRVDGLFTGKPQGPQITDLAGRDPTQGYRISEIDNGAVTFYGFTNKDGAWFIMKEDIDSGSFRYARASNGFEVNWGNRKDLKYNFFDKVF